MDFKIDLSPEAVENLEEITAWIARDDPDRAERFGNALLDRVKILGDFPEIGSTYSGNPDVRKLVSPPYIIVYRVLKKMRRVEVITFRHSKRGPLR